jgi:AcrR family transcriptional regulator
MTEDTSDTHADPGAPSTRDRLVAASFQLFLQHGFDGTGLSQILSATGLSKGAFYHYFPTKEALYHEVVENFFLKPIRTFDFAAFDTQNLRDSRNVLAEAYLQLPGAVKAAGIDMARYFALFFEAFSRLDDFRNEMRSYYAALLKSLAQRTYEQHEIFPKVAENHAINIIAALEGRLFLTAVFGADGMEPLVAPISNKTATG